MSQKIQIINPFPDALIQHLVTKDPQLFEALTDRKTIEVFGDPFNIGLKNAVDRTFISKLSEIPSIMDFGADGSKVRDTTAVNSLSALNLIGFVPTGIWPTSLAAYNSQEGRFWGLGQLKDSNGAGCIRAREYTVVLTTPTDQGHADSHQTSFTGDNSKTGGINCNPFELYLGPNSTGSVIAARTEYYELCPRFGVVTIEGGFNGTVASGGRSQLAIYGTILHQNGQGDSYVYNGIILVNGTNPASPFSFLECPAGSLLTCSIVAGGVYRYLNTIELQHNDGGFDCAAIAMVSRFNRTVDTGALGCVWMGQLIRSNGSKSMDAFVSAGGKCRIGLDFSFATFDTSGTWTKAAIVLKAGDRIYGNGVFSSVGSFGLMPDSVGDAWYRFESAAWQWVIGGGTALVLQAGDLAIVNGSVSIKSAQSTPGGSTGLVHIYMDAGDGELKYQLPAGTVRIINYH